MHLMLFTFQFVLQTVSILLDDALDVCHYTDYVSRFEKMAIISV